jgi:hypothetical protein
MLIDMHNTRMIQSRNGELPVLFFSATATTTQVDKFHLALTTSYRLMQVFVFN